MTPHIWKKVGRKDDECFDTSYFLWSCSECGAKVTMKTTYWENENPAPAHSHPPAPGDLELCKIDLDCLTHLVNSIHNR